MLGQGSQIRKVRSKGKSEKLGQKPYVDDNMEYHNSNFNNLFNKGYQSPKPTKM